MNQVTENETGVKAGIPIWRKYTLSVQEASEYFHIGYKKLRKLIDEHPDADFILWNGSRPQIKRRKFEAYIDENLSASRMADKRFSVEIESGLWYIKCIIARLSKLERSI